MSRLQVIGGHVTRSCDQQLNRSHDQYRAFSVSAARTSAQENTNDGKVTTKAVIFDMGGVLVPSPGMLFKG